MGNKHSLIVLSHSQLIYDLSSLRDALLCAEKNSTLRRTSQLVAKLGAGSAAGGAMYAAAAAFGTASTGTAIGTLSGAAFTSASLAWIGGSVATGAMVVSGGAIIAGIAGFVGAKKIWFKYISSQTRDSSQLSPREMLLVNSIEQLVISLETLEKENCYPPKYAEKIMWSHAISQIIKESGDLLKSEYYDWQWLSKRRLKKAVQTLKTTRARKYAENIQDASLSVGIITAVILKLLNNENSYTESEELVLEAFRRSSNQLSDASIEEISQYISSMEPAQLVGIQNNIKGIYHELAYVNAENNDRDAYVAELFSATNHPGADIRLINQNTNEVVELQLKATDSVAYINEHFSKYQDIGVLATEEVASKIEGVESSGFSNEELESTVSSFFSKIDGNGEMFDSLEVSTHTGLLAAFITMVTSIGSSLAERRGLQESGELALIKSSDAFKVAAASALIIELVL